VDLLVFDRGEVVAGRMQPPVVPVGPLQGGQLDVIDGLPGPRRRISSVLNNPICDSARALSSASPTLPTLGCDAARGKPLGERDRGVLGSLPLSLWTTAPGVGRRRQRAISRATTSSERMWSAIDQPTTTRLNTSRTAAQYTLPSAVGAR